MPRRGVRAGIEVFPQFLPGLHRIEQNSHIMVIAWLHRAERDLLQVQRPRWEEGPRGVFACRSPSRPNPIGITTVKLLRREGANLDVEPLDFIDGTPVLDIKPHSAGLDGVFAARSARDLTPIAKFDPAREREAMLREAENFHGELCPGIALGVRMLYHTGCHFNVAQKDPELRVYLGEDGCICDALQALTGATFGNGRLRVSREASFAIGYRERELVFLARAQAGSWEEAMQKDMELLFEIWERRQGDGAGTLRGDPEV